MCDMTHSYVWHDSLICVTWLIHMCDMTHSYAWQDSLICVTYLGVAYSCTSLIHSHELLTCHSFTVTLNHSHTYLGVAYSCTSHSFPCVTCLTWFRVAYTSHMWMRNAVVTWLMVIHSRRRSDFKYLDLQIIQFSWIFFWVTETPFTQLKTCLKLWGLPRKCVRCVRELLWKLVGIFGSRNYFKSDFLRLSIMLWGSYD